MAKKIDYNCEMCGHIAVKKKNWKTRIWGAIRPFLVVIIVINFLIGSMGLYNFIQGNVYESPDKILSLGQMYSFVVNMKSKLQFGERDEQLKNIAKDIVKDCNTEECKARTLFDYLLKFDYRYENATDLDPIKTWEERKGDCDQMSYLFILLMHTQKITSMIDCDNTHCWTIIDIGEKKIIADITKNRWIEYE